MQFDMDKAQRRLDRKIAQLRTKSYISEDVISLLDEVAHRQLLARGEATVTVPMDLEMAPVEAVLQGMSLVAREEFPFDIDQATALLEAFIGILVAKGGPLGDAAAGVRAVLDSGELTAETLFRHFLDDDTRFFGIWAERYPEAPRTLAFLAFSAMIPSLEATADVLAAQLPDMKVPVSGSCPICGSLPLISSLKEKEGLRHATCSFCRHEYRIKRIACPVCGEEDQKKLTFFTVEEEPGFRVDVCESCKTYIKTIDFRELDRVAVPVLDDLDSLALDYVAAGQGYRRATLSAWGF